MTDRTAEFFDALARRGHEPRLAKVDGTLRFDLERDGRPEHWYMTVRRGDVSVRQTPEPLPADCILHTTRAWFDKFVTGEEAVLAALLRADAIAEGNLHLMYHIQRLTPDPPGARDPRDLQPSAAEAR